MPAIDSFDAKSTSVNFSWPPEVTGLERIMLSAQADLQRLLSAFYARTINVDLVYSSTFSDTSSSDIPSKIHSSPIPSLLLIPTASPSTPIVQNRQVRLLCASQIVCTATSTVRITSPECAHLFLAEKFAIGQVFRKLGRPPRFVLSEVGVGPVRGVEKEETSGPMDKEEQLWRKYTVGTEGFECEILEVFPSRDMFVHGEEWLEEKIHGREHQHSEERLGLSFSLSNGIQPKSRTGWTLVLSLCLLFTWSFEVFALLSGRSC